MQIKRINVIGMGYIGLPTAVILIKAGYQVVGTDKNKDIVESVNSCNVSTNEPGLHNAVRDYVESGLLTCSTEPEAADVYIICVPTPIDSCTTSKAPDLSHIYDVISNIAPLIKARDFIIIESTCPVGTLSSIRSYMKNLEVDVDSIHLAQCPERVLPGQIMRELVENDRIVGGFNNNDTKLVADFYRTFVKGDVLETNAQTAELCKLAENSFRDVNIAFANELSIICEKEDINIYELINIANRHPRVNILQPGQGWRSLSQLTHGSCNKKRVWRRSLKRHEKSTTLNHLGCFLKF